MTNRVSNAPKPFNGLWERARILICGGFGLPKLLHNCIVRLQGIERRNGILGELHRLVKVIGKLPCTSRI
jgi:hypothetical protein